MKLRVLCTDPQHPVQAWLARWCEHQGAAGHDARVLHHSRELDGEGDFLLLVSCHQIIGAAQREQYRHTLVLHASPLPLGRGMSPHIWQVLQGARSITVTLLQAVAQLDEGDIWQQRVFSLQGHELHDEIHQRLFDAELELMNWAVLHCDHAQPRPQHGEPSYFARRRPADHRIDPTRPLAECFDLLRVSDPERYPVYFEHRGRRFRLRIDALDPPATDPKRDE